MIFDPIFILSKLLVKVFFRNISFNFLNSLLKLTFTLTRNIGILTTIKIIKKLFIFININTSKIINLETLRNFLFSHSFNSFATSLIIDWAYVNIDYLRSLDISTLFKLKNILLLIIYIISLKLFLKNFLKFSILSILTAFGISWNTFLSSINFLKYLSDNIIQFLGLDLINIKNNIININENSKDILNSNDLNNFSYLYILSLIFVIVSTGIILTDWMIPGYITKIPYLGNIIDEIYNFFNNIWDHISNISNWNKMKNMLDWIYNLTINIRDFITYWLPFKKIPFIINIWDFSYSYFKKTINYLKYFIPWKKDNNIPSPGSDKTIKPLSPETSTINIESSVNDNNSLDSLPLNFPSPFE